MITSHNDGRLEHGVLQPDVAVSLCGGLQAHLDLP
jgi:hypothetical protein